jgi:hypothetical protein
MNLKDMKIYIHEIPKEWEDRTRTGHTNVWNEGSSRNELPEVKLKPPIRGLYALRFDDGWYWVCGCSKCLGIEEPYPYIVCDEHDRCISCKIQRDQLKEVPWGKPGGWQCKPCNRREHSERKNKAIEEAQARGHSEDDYSYTDEIICPVCGSENSNDDMNGKAEHKVTCCICDTEFIVTADYVPKYTSRLE